MKQRSGVGRASVPDSKPEVRRKTPREYDDHQNMYYDFIRELTELCRDDNPRRPHYGLFKNSVSVKRILDLKLCYAEAESRMFDRSFAKCREISARYATEHPEFPMSETPDTRTTHTDPARDPNSTTKES